MCIKVNLVNFHFMLTFKDICSVLLLCPDILPLESLFSYMSIHRQIQDLGGNIANQIVLYLKSTASVP